MICSNIKKIKVIIKYFFCNMYIYIKISVYKKLVYIKSIICSC